MMYRIIIVYSYTTQIFNYTITFQVGLEGCWQNKVGFSDQVTSSLKIQIATLNFINIVIKMILNLKLWYIIAYRDGITYTLLYFSYLYALGQQKYNLFTLPFTPLCNFYDFSHINGLLFLMNSYVGISHAL